MNSPSPDWSNTRLVAQCLAGDDRAWNAFEAPENGGGKPLEQEVRSHVGIEQ